MKYIFHPNILQLPVGGRRNPHPTKYLGCRHAEEEVRKKKTQRTPRTTTGREFSSNLTTPGTSLAAALRGKPEEQQQRQPH
jgi:hypothetical protein